MEKRHLLLANNICTYIFYPAFVLLLLWLGASGHPDLLRTVLTCGVSFVVVTILRRAINAPRPYEKDPAIEPPKADCRKGHSFPSRHVFSAWVITMTFFYFDPLLGLLLTVPATLLAYLRQKLHFHHKPDVIWGAAIGIACAVVGFWVI